MSSLVELEPFLARYAWGHPSLVGKWLGDAGAGLVAEAWFGTHRSGPTGVVGRSGHGTLAELVADDPEFHLGPGETRLRWLVKLLGAAQPLSLQAHPDMVRAAARFAEQHPSYVDGFGKPEVLVAFTDTWAFIGFDTPLAVTERAVRLGVGELVELVSVHGVAGSVRRLLADRVLAARLAEQVAVAVRGVPEFAATLGAVVRVWGADPGLSVALCLRPVFLRPGDAVGIPAGVLHAYVSGGGLEVMGASDNVLRGGLTNKPVDVDELLELLDDDCGPVEVVDTARFGSAVLPFTLPCRVRRGVGGSEMVPLTVSGPGVVWCPSGVATLVERSGARTDLVAGRAAFVPFGVGDVTVVAGSVWVVDRMSDGAVG